MTFKATDDWCRDFVKESNKIDPQPGHENKPGDPRWDDHMAALRAVIREGNAGEMSWPNRVHENPFAQRWPWL